MISDFKCLKVPSGNNSSLKCRQIRTHVHKQKRQELNHAEMTCPNVTINLIIIFGIAFHSTSRYKSCFLEYQIIQQTDNEDNLSILLKRIKRITLGCITLLMLKPHTRQFCFRQIQLLFATCFFENDYIVFTCGSSILK